MADVVGCTSPEGDICEVNTYFVYLIQQIECAFRFQYRIFLYMFLDFRLYMFYFAVMNKNAAETAVAQ